MHTLKRRNISKLPCMMYCSFRLAAKDVSDAWEAMDRNETRELKSAGNIMFKKDKPTVAGIFSL